MGLTEHKMLARLLTFPERATIQLFQRTMPEIFISLADLDSEKQQVPATCTIFGNIRQQIIVGHGWEEQKQRMSRVLMERLECLLQRTSREAGTLANHGPTEWV